MVFDLRHEIFQLQKTFNVVMSFVGKGTKVVTNSPKTLRDIRFFFGGLTETKFKDEIQ